MFVTNSAASFHPVTLAQASTETNITKVLALLYGIYSAKFAELAGGVIESTVHHHYLVFAYCGRGFIETTATLRFYSNKTRKLFSSAKNPDVFDAAELSAIAKLLDKHARGGRFDWTRYWKVGRKDMVDHLASTGSAPEKTAMSNPSQVNVETTIDTWVSGEPAIELIYDYFCELVHPNIGSKRMRVARRISIGLLTRRHADLSSIRSNLRRTSGSPSRAGAWPVNIGMAQ